MINSSDILKRSAAIIKTAGIGAFMNPVSVKYQFWPLAVGPNTKPPFANLSRYYGYEIRGGMLINRQNRATDGD